MSYSTWMIRRRGVAAATLASTLAGCGRGELAITDTDPSSSGTSTTSVEASSSSPTDPTAPTVATAMTTDAGSHSASDGDTDPDMTTSPGTSTAAATLTGQLDGRARHRHERDHRHRRARPASRPPAPRARVRPASAARGIAVERRFVYTERMVMRAARWSVVGVASVLGALATAGCLDPNPYYLETDPSASDSTSGEPATDGGMATTSAPTTDVDPTTDGSPATSDTSLMYTDTNTDTGPDPNCGDAKLDPGEECDDGPLNDDGGACTSFCKLAFCGDGLLFPQQESCDDGLFNADGAACTSQCMANICGDGLLLVGQEECDNGADNSDSADCTAGCKLASCGDGLIHIGKEVCDDGDLLSDNGCAGCTVPTSCKEIHDIDPNGKTGIYAVDVDGPGLQQLIPVFCDMDTAGGGWTVIERSPLGVNAIGRAYFKDAPKNVDDPGATIHRLPKMAMDALQAAASDMRIHCGGDDYLMTSASKLYSGEGVPPQCLSVSASILYSEARLKGHMLINTPMCTLFLGKNDGECPGAWSIDEIEQSLCGNQNFPWTGGEAVTTDGADTFATDAAVLDKVNPVHDCHKPGAARITMLR